MPDVPPNKPSEFNQIYLRYIDPSDPTKLMAIALVDTGTLAPDGVKIYALGTASAGGSATSPIVIDKIYYKFIGPAILKQLYSPFRDNMIWTDSEETMEGALPTVVAGRGIKNLSVVYYSLAPAATFEFGTVFVAQAGRIMGAIQHKFTTANPGKLILKMGPEAAVGETTFPNSTHIEVVLDDTNNYLSTAGRVTFSLERTDPYFRYSVTNNGAAAAEFRITVNAGV